jgi:hypothetical protein
LLELVQRLLAEDVEGKYRHLGGFGREHHARPRQYNAARTNSSALFFIPPSFD